MPRLLPIIVLALLVNSCANRPQGCLGFEPHCSGNVAQARCDVHCRDSKTIPLLYNCRTSISKVDCAATGDVCRGRAICVDKELSRCDYPQSGRCDPADPRNQLVCWNTGVGNFIRTVKLPEGKQCIGEGSAHLTVDTPLVTCKEQGQSCQNGISRQCRGVNGKPPFYLGTHKCEKGCMNVSMCR